MAKKRKRNGKRSKARRRNPGSAPSWAKNLMGAKKKRKRSNPRRSHGKRKNPGSHRRRRRHNPGTSFELIKNAFIAVAIGAGVGLLGTVLVNGALASSSSTTKTGALAVLAAGAAAFLPGHPMIAAGIATGLLLVPGQQLLAGILPPSLLGIGTSTTPAATTAAATTTAPATSGLGYLNGGRIGGGYVSGRTRMGLLNPRSMAGLTSLSSVHGTDEMLGIRRAG